MKIKRVANQKKGHYGWSFTCPGCGNHHVIPTEAFAPQHNWAFNGNADKPTFTPSLRVSWTMGGPPTKHLCHSIITDGRIQFCGDCTHSLAGQTVDLPDIAEAQS